MFELFFAFVRHSLQTQNTYHNKQSSICRQISNPIVRQLVKYRPLDILESGSGIQCLSHAFRSPLPDLVNKTIRLILQLAISTITTCVKHLTQQELLFVLVNCKINYTIPTLMHQMCISTNQVSSMVPRPK